MKLDPFAQRSLLDLAGADRQAAAARHRKANLPALTVIATVTGQLNAVRREIIEAETEVSDLERATNRLDNEVTQVRARASRDQQRLQAGQGAPRELENLQHEIESLTRRQGVLEDEELELMERRENADAALATVRAQLASLDSTLSATAGDRDREFVELDAQLDALAATRARLTGGLPADVLALYSRIAASGKVAAGELRGSRCSACQLEIDRTALAEIRAAPIDEVVRCSECGAILVRV